MTQETDMDKINQLMQMVAMSQPSTPQSGYGSTAVPQPQFSSPTPNFDYPNSIFIPGVLSQ